MVRPLLLVTPLASLDAIQDFDNHDILAVDAGVLLVKDHPRLIGAIGDFDSMEEMDYQQLVKSGITIEKLNVKKDITDLDVALSYGFDHGYTHIDVLGAIGGRIDHSYANILLLSRYPNTVIYHYANGKMMVTTSSLTLSQDHYQRFSLFALQPCELSISNALYELDHYHLNPDDPLCISNQWLDQVDASIILFHGKLLVIWINENPLVHSTKEGN